VKAFTASPRTQPPSRSELRPYTPGVDPLDRLYDLLPAYIRARDMERDQPLRALLRVMAEPLLIVADDIARLYENWFIETCDAWAVSYVAAPVGYSILPEPSLDGLADFDGPAARQRFAWLAPRRDAANTLAHRRRKGTLPVFQQLANDLTAWPARAVEFRDRTAVFQNLNHLRPDRGFTIDVRRLDEIDRGFGPFATLTRTLDLRSAGVGPEWASGKVGEIGVRTSGPDPYWGRGKVGDIGLYVWPLRVKRVTHAPAALIPPQKDGTVCRNDDCRYDYTFSAVGNMTPLYHRPLLPHDPARIATEPEIAAPIRLEAFREHRECYYGVERSLRIWKRDRPADKIQEVPLKRILAADLNRRPVALEPRGKYLVAVDPEHGLLTLVYRTRPVGQRKEPELWVSYRYGAPGNIGGGDYYRPLETGIPECGSMPAPAGGGTPVTPCRVFVRSPDDESGSSVETGTRDQPFPTLNDAISKAWNSANRIASLVIEILDDGLYTFGPDPIQIGQGERFEIRAAQGQQPMVSIDQANFGPITFISGNTESGGTLVLDGLLVLDSKLVIEGPFEGVAIRHCTLVPGLMLECDGTPTHKNSPSLELHKFTGPLWIDYSIVGAISVLPVESTENGSTDGPALEYRDEPHQMRVTDSILDNAGGSCPAIGGKTSCAFARMRLWIERATVFGPVNVYAIDRAQDTLFTDLVKVARRRQGCMRFCCVPPKSTTPARYRCQPDLAPAGSGNPAPCEKQATPSAPMDRDQVASPIVPRFRSQRYGDPDYALFASDAPMELTRGAEDLSEMGAFHDESIAMRQANLRIRVAEYVPAGADIQIIEVFE